MQEARKFKMNYIIKTKFIHILWHSLGSRSNRGAQIVGSFIPSVSNFVRTRVT